MAELAAYLLRSAACLAALTLFYRLVLMRDANFGLNRGLPPRDRRSYPWPSLSSG
ncbi:MAG: hypothetical protein MZU84_05855 [Sphingobacterium sp.]|nr:hypothetical protein [Sphingobacterium sp.]